MDKTQPIFVAKRLGRKKQFSVSTSIFAEGSGFIVRKHPIYPEANDHILHMAKIHAQLSSLKGLGSKISLTPISVTGKSASFPFVNGRELERAVFEALLANDETYVLEILQRFTEILEPFEQKMVNPTDNPEFVKIFGRSWDLTSLCILPGYVDLTMDNIIIDDAGKWHLIDYEWLFDFPVPIEFIIGRMLWWFFGARYGNILREHADRLHLLEIGNGMIVPEYVVKVFKGYFEYFDEILSMEAAFQQYVTGSAVDYSERRLYKKPKPISRPDNLIEDYLFVKSRSYELEPQMAELRAAHAVLEEQYTALLKEYTALTESRGYRAVRKAQNIKKRFIK